MANTEVTVGDVATVDDTTEAVWTAHDEKAGVSDPTPITSLDRQDGETDAAFASRLVAAAADLTRPPGVKGPDPDVWGDAARKERGAHLDDAPPVPDGPAQLIDAATGDVVDDNAWKGDPSDAAAG